jgi:hypothetical protein
MTAYSTKLWKVSDDLWELESSDLDWLLCNYRSSTQPRPKEKTKTGVSGILVLASVSD